MTAPVIMLVEIMPKGKPAAIINVVDRYFTMPTRMSRYEFLLPPAKKLLISVNPPPIQLLNAGSRRHAQLSVLVALLCIIRICIIY